MRRLKVFSGCAAALMGILMGVLMSAGASCAAELGAPATVKPDAVVAADGSGDYKTVQTAVDAAPNKAKRRFVIHIKPGTYKEKIRVSRDKGPITFWGENAETTILTFDDAASTVRDGKAVGTSGSYSVQVQAKDFIAENITFENSAGQTAGQAVALYVDGDRAIFCKCRLLGWQDTLYAGSGHQYYEECIIAGSVDYIFGGATAWFERCELRSRAGGAITAASTPQEQPYGYVFSHCIITAPSSEERKAMGRFRVVLGRPWREYASVTFLNTKMLDAVAPEGWDRWYEGREKTARYAEYNSQAQDGKPLNVSGRVPWAKQLTVEEAAQYTIPNVLGGTGSQSPFGMRSSTVTRPASPISAPPGTLPAQNVTIYGTNARLENDGANIGFWSDTDTSFEWPSNVPPGVYRVSLHYALDAAQAGSEIQVTVGDKNFKLTPPATGGWGDYKTVEVGELEIKQPNTPVALSALSQKGDFILNVRQVTLAGKNGADNEAQPNAITPERIGTLPPEQRAAWQAYYERSQAHLRTDKTALTAEVKAAGLEKPLPAPAGVGLGNARKAPAEWFASDEARRMADAAVSFQTPSGGWSKGVAFDQGLRKSGMHWTTRSENWYYVGTFDNGANQAPMTALARIYQATKDPKHAAAFLKGLDYIFDAQFPNGGWPQNYPLSGGYHDEVTFNDNAMTNVVALLRDVANGSPQYSFVDEARRAKARTAMEEGLRCILKAQIVQNGKRTAWCAQHDPITLLPAAARNFEVASLSGWESADVVRLLMSIEPPTPEVKTVVESAVAWFESVKITGFEIVSSLNAAGGRVFTLKPNPNAGPLWARFYEIGTNRPIFVTREAKVYYNLSDLDQSGPGAGYNWYVNAPQKLLEDDYPKWRAKWAPEQNVPR